MPLIEVEGLTATCGHPQVAAYGGGGVTIGDLKPILIGVDNATGTITGPGSQSVFVNDIGVSLPGDLVTPHSPCWSPVVSHCVAKTNPGSNTSNVYAGTGFTIGPGGVGGDYRGVDAPDLITTFLLIEPSTAPALTPLVFYVGVVTLTYTIQNFGHDAGEFSIGLYSFDNEDNTIGIPHINPASTGELIEEHRILGIPAGGSYEGSFTMESTEDGPNPDWSNLLPPIWYSVHPDIHDELLEPDEDNAIPAVSFTVT